eukprot:736368-Prorocentrum_lima.AAC.1
MGVWDVSRAHFYGTCQREIYANLPEELARDGCIARLRKTMYGTQDASQIWQFTWGEHLRNNGYKIGVSSPAFYPTAS